MRQRFSLFFLMFFLGLGIVLIWLVCWWDRLIGIKLPFPRNLEELEKQQEWCIHQLQRTSAIPPDITVLSYKVDAFQVSKTFRSHMAKLTVTHQANEDSQTRTFQCLAKFAPQQGSLWNRIVFIIQGNHLKEVGVYNDLAEQLGTLIPRSYGAFVAGFSGYFCILMEEVKEAKAYSEQEGCPLSTVPTVLDGMASYHAMFWDTQRQTLPSWLAPIPVAAIDFFLLFGKDLDSILSRCSRTLWLANNQPKTLLHGDARVGNMLFQQDTQQVVFYDWQAARLGMPTFDIAYFLVLSVASEVRIEYEKQWLKEYHEKLCQRGVEDYQYDQFVEDYQKACLVLLLILGLPFLSSELSLEDQESRDNALHGGLIWSERIHAMVTHFDESFLLSSIGTSREELLRKLEQSMLHPHKMNHGSWLVANYLREHGGIKALKKVANKENL